MQTPRYPFPVRTALRLVCAWIFKPRLSFRREAVNCTSRLQPRLKVTGVDHLPYQQPYLITVNHYTRPGVPAWWVALAVSSAVPEEVHWVMTSTWRFEGRRFSRQLARLSRLALGHIAQTFGFTPMPPMPPDPQETNERASAVRRLLASVQHTPCAVIGLAPEGMDTPGGRLSNPAPGVGRFIYQLSRRGLLIVPAGVFEFEGRLKLKFGAGYHLDIPEGINAHERDRMAADQVMRAIASQLPPHLRGDYDTDENGKQP